MQLRSRINPFPKGSKAGIVCCSNGQPLSAKSDIKKLEQMLADIGMVPVFSDYIFVIDGVAAGTACQRAKALMDFYLDDEIKVIFDISGGDTANEILPYLDFNVISESRKTFCGYSDLTTIINAIYTQSACDGACMGQSVLYQVRNFIYDHGVQQRYDFAETMFMGKENLFSLDVDFVQGQEMKGIVVGGNIRCLLKLAGTKYFPDMKDKILLLEAYGGLVPQMTTYLSQLAQMGVFNQVTGILLGTFTKLEQEEAGQGIEKGTIMPELLKRFVGEKLPIACTRLIGHGTDSKAIIIGGSYRF